MPREKLTIIQDTREQRPWRFPKVTQYDGTVYDIEVVRRKLGAGDYSLEGFEDQIAVERKSVPDFVQSVTRSRERFTRELGLLKDMRLGCVVVEGDLSEILDGAFPGSVAPATVVTHVLSIWRKGVPVLFSTDAPSAARTALALLLSERKRCRRGRTP